MPQTYQSLDTHDELSLSYCRKVVFAIVALAILIFTVYGNSLDCSWHFDDEANITGNPKIHLKEISLHNIKEALCSGLNKPNHLYRPVACLSFALNYYFGDLNVLGYHLTNIFIHIFSSIFLFLFIYHTLKLPLLRGRYSHNAYFIALLSSVLWSINPVQNQAVTYLVQRMASMAGMFYIISMYCYLKARTAEAHFRKATFFALSFLCFVMALGCKENAAMLPLTIFLLDFFLLQEHSKERTRKNLKIFLMVLSAILFVGFAYLYSNGGNIFSFLEGYKNRPFTLGQRLLTEPRIIVFYASLLFYPVSTRLSIAHAMEPSSSLFDPITTIISILLILVIIVLAISIRTRRPVIAFCIIFFFLNHVIESTIFPLELVFEHRNYIPSMLFFVPVAIGLSSLFNYYETKRSMQYILSAFVVLILIGLGHSTFFRNFAWKNEKTLWIDAIEKAPNLSRPHHNLGRYYDDHGYQKEAILEYKQALEKAAYNQKNEKFVTYYDLGLIYGNLKDLNTALDYYKKAASLNSEFPPVYNNIASIMDRKKRHRVAYNYLTKAIKLNPYSKETNFNLGLYYLRNGQPDKAIFHLSKAANIEGINPNTLLYLGIAYKQKGQLGRAATYFEKAIKANPRNISPHLHLAEVFYRAHDYKRAREQAGQSVDFIPNKKAFERILRDFFKGDESRRLHPDATIVIPLMRDAFIIKEKNLEECSELLKENALN